MEKNHFKTPKTSRQVLGKHSGRLRGADWATDWGPNIKGPKIPINETFL